MNPLAAQTLALDLMHAHGFHAWSFRWNRGRRTLGTCNETTKTIALSAVYVQLNDEPHVRDTILHEIAHAIAGVKNGHNHVWKAVCRRIGADPKRLNRTAHMPPAPFEIYCPCCESVVARRYRRVRESTLDRMGCGRCGRISLGELLLRRRLEFPSNA